MEAGAPAAGTAEPGSPGWPSPSRLASFPIDSGDDPGERNDVVDGSTVEIKLRENSTLLPFRHHHLQVSIPHGARALTERVTEHAR